MPLLRKKEFQKSTNTELFRDDEEVFYCEVTSEIFRDYDEFCQRIILVNSMVWSCAMTGKMNLTYAEALLSEQTAKNNLKDFPIELRTPVLYLATKTARTSFAEMTEDVFAFIKDRYFVGETVESSFNENNWRESHVLQVIAPNEEQIKEYLKTHCKSPDRLSCPPAALYRYEIEELDPNEEDKDSSQSYILSATNIRRKKGPYTKEKNRLFLKQFVEMNDRGIICIKESIRRKYRLDSVHFDQIFDGPLPDFTATVRKQPQVNGKKVRQETMAKYLEKPGSVNKKINNENGKSLLEEMKRKEEEYKEKLAFMKAKRVEEKNLEKQKRKEENLKMSSYVKEWYKPRDDLELEDHRRLPEPIPVHSKIPDEYFGDALMVLEFAHSFSSLLSTNDFFPGGLTMDLLERALIEKEVAGPLTDIIQMFLTALFNIQDEEAAENKDSQSQADVNSDESITVSEATRLATLASNWSVAYQGMPLSRLPLYPLTISEVLRLHLLSSGARLSEAASKWRYQQRGGYMSEDDPGLQLRMKHPHILKSLATHNVNQLPVADKIIILTCLTDQLLTYADVRDIIEERLERSKQLKADLKALQIAERRYEQESVSNRMRIKREHKMNPAVLEKELEKQQLEADKKRAEFEKQNQDLTKSYSELQIVLGTDRGYQRYIKIEALPGFFVENDERNPGICMDRIITQKPDLVGADTTHTLNHIKKLYEECNGSDKENHQNGLKKLKKLNGIKIKNESEISTATDLLMCTAKNFPCPIHTENYKPTWSFYNDKTQVDQLINSLNKRGIRESELRQVLETERDHLESLILETNATKLNPTIETIKKEEPESLNINKPVSKKVQNMLSRYEDSSIGFPADMKIAEILNLSLIDNILEMEEKIDAGSLGKLNVKDRFAWRTNLSKRNYDQLEKTIKRSDENKKLEKLKTEERNSRPGTPDSYKDPGRYLGSTQELNGDDSESEEKSSTISTEEQFTAVRTLSIALLQVAQAVDQKYLKKPLGHADASAKKKEEIDVLEKWEQSLLAATSYSQIFLHYCTLDNCIMWTRSALLARCRICHRQRDPQNMLLCDNCNKGHHLYCLKPKLTAVPKGDWFCDKCKPKEKPPTPRSTQRTRKIFTELSDEEEDEDEDYEVEEEEEQELNTTKEESYGEIPFTEVCDVCGAGGHVICCDFCPKVYHLECAQPPLRRVPRGNWKCHKCKRKSDKRNGRKEPRESVDPDFLVWDSAVTQHYFHDGGRRCAAQARNKIHGFVRSLRRTSVDSGSGEEIPTHRRTTRRGQESKGGVEDDDLPLHNAALQELLADVMRHKDAWPFVRPVTKAEVPDYFDVIKTPMDFGTVKYKLNMGEYKCDSDVLSDCVLVFENCDTYNNSEALVYKCGVRLCKFFEKRAHDLHFEFPAGLLGTGTAPEDPDDEPTQPKRPRQ